MYQAVDINESALRKCVVIKWWDLIGVDFEDKFSAVLGAVLIILPKDVNELTKQKYQVSFILSLASIFGLKLEKNFLCFKMVSPPIFLILSCNFLLSRFFGIYFCPVSSIFH